MQLPNERFEPPSKRISEGFGGRRALRGDNPTDLAGCPLSSKSMRMPSPGSVIEAAHQLTTVGYAGGTLLTHTLYSMKLALFGFVVAAGSAVTIGLAMGFSRTVEAIFGPIIAFIRPISSACVDPACDHLVRPWPRRENFRHLVHRFRADAINTYTGVRTIDPTLVAAARVHGAGTRRLLLDVYLPGAAPMIFAGLRVSLQASWMAPLPPNSLAPSTVWDAS